MVTSGLNQDSNNENEEISLKDLLLKLIDWYKFLLSKWLLIATFIVLGGVLGGIYANYKKAIYKATTTFVLENGENSGGLGQYAGIASMVGIDIGGGGGGLFQGDNIIELYKSRSMIEQALLSEINYKNKNQLLINLYIDFNDLRKGWDKKPELKNIDFLANSKFKTAKFSRLQDSILGTIALDISKNYLVVSKPDKKLSIIEVNVKAKNELFAKAFNDQIVKNVNDFYIKTKTRKSLENVAILKEKTDSVRAVMNGAIYRSVSVSDATPNLNPTRQIQRAAPMQQAQFSTETNKVILGELVKNLEMSKMALLKETPLIQVLDQPIFPLEKEALGKVKGVLFGGFIFGTLTMLILIFRRVINHILMD